MPLSRAWLVPPLLGVAAALAADARAGAPIEVEALDRSDASGIADVSHTYGATVADWNDDGWDDLLLNKHYDAFPQLHLNDESIFENAYESAFPTTPPRRDYHGCAAADVDLNGFLDVYCTVGGHRGGIGPNAKELWLQGPDGVFHEAADAWGATDRFGRGREATFLDANGDEFPDLYVTNQQPRKDGKRGANVLFLNEAGERFRNAPEYGLNRQLGGYSVQAIDFDLDGRQDVLLCSQRGLRLFRNVGGARFESVTKRVRAKGSCYRGAVLARMNRDRRPDLVRVAQDRVEVRLQGAAEKLRRKPVLSRHLTDVAALALGDMNADRIPDIYAARRGTYRPKLPDDEQVDARDVMLASNGSVESYARFPIPQTTEGIAESVAAIDHDRNGLADFVVMNGRLQASGPTRLVAFYPAEP
jgi:FG-GAP-like repeat